MEEKPTKNIDEIKFGMCVTNDSDDEVITFFGYANKPTSKDIESLKEQLTINPRQYNFRIPIKFKLRESTEEELCQFQKLYTEIERGVENHED